LFQSASLKVLPPITEVLTSILVTFTTNAYLIGILPSIQEENENDKTSMHSGRKDEESLSQKINSASKELPVHPSLDTDNNTGTPDTIDIIEEYPTGPIVNEESK
jgi:hypothetical protein